MTSPFAVFRLPDSETLYLLAEGQGEDFFTAQPFNSHAQALRISGSSSVVDLNEVIPMIDGLAFDEIRDGSGSAMSTYRPRVSEAIAAIRSGEFDKVVIAAFDDVPSTTSPSELFSHMLSRYPDAFVYFFYTHSVSMLGASPETLIARNGQSLYTEALGGTRTHGGYAEKEYMEHDQIRDFIKSRLNESAYVYKEAETRFRPAGAVEHLRTPYSIESRGLANDKQLRDALHPTSAVCGLPRKTAMAFIEKTEGFDRRYYAGYVGPEFKNGDFFNYVNLRCAEVYKGSYRLYAGAGINALSDPEDEYHEINQKMKTIRNLLK